MEQKKFLEIIKQAGKLKTETRHNWTEEGRKESVADHSWRLALMAMLLSGEAEYEGLDLNRVIRMCLIHDLGESFTGDIPTFEKSTEDGEMEDELFEQWVKEFPESTRDEWGSLLFEMKEQRTQEAKLYKALDKIEAVIAHDEADTHSWLPLEYDLQKTYGKKEAGFSPWMRGLHDAVDHWTDEKIRSSKEI